MEISVKRSRAPRGNGERRCGICRESTAGRWWGRLPPGRQRPDFYSNGHFGQRIYVSPDKRLVPVRLGSDSGNRDWTGLLAGIAERWPAGGAGPPRGSR